MSGKGPGCSTGAARSPAAASAAATASAAAAAKAAVAWAAGDGSAAEPAAATDLRPVVAFTSRARQRSNPKIEAWHT